MLYRSQVKGRHIGKRYHSSIQVNYSVLGLLAVFYGSRSHCLQMALFEAPLSKDTAWHALPMKQGSKRGMRIHPVSSGRIYCIHGGIFVWTVHSYLLNFITFRYEIYPFITEYFSIFSYFIATWGMVFLVEAFHLICITKHTKTGWKNTYWNPLAWTTRFLAHHLGNTLSYLTLGTV